MRGREEGRKEDRRSRDKDEKGSKMKCKAVFVGMSRRRGREVG